MTKQTQLDPLEDPLKIFGSKRTTISKITVLATGLAVALMAATINPAPTAQAYPDEGAACTGCHTPGGSVTATPSAGTQLPGASYTVALAFTGGTSPVGYWISGTGADVNGDGAGPVSMTAPVAPGSYTYTVWMRSGVVASTTYSIVVGGAPVAVTTTTALAVTPTSPVVAPASPTLTATVTGANAAGTVQFLNGTTVLGTSTVAAGQASTTLSGIAAGSYSYTAKFIPTSADAFTPSTSSAVPYVVTAAVPTAVTTTTALAMAPTAVTAVAPAARTLTATVSGAGAAGLVEFFNGTASLGTSPVVSGTATLGLTAIGVGDYSYHAVFTPTDATLFTSSASVGSLAFSVTFAAPTAVTTTTALAVSPASAEAPASLTLTATVTGTGAAGSVEFFNGTISLGTSSLSAAGVADYPLVGVVAGDYSYHAVFTPTDATLFTSSTSANVAFTATVPAPVQVTTTTALAMAPSAVTAVAPAEKTLTATVTGANAAGTVEFVNGTTSLGSSPVAAGSATLALTDIGMGDYSYHAVFTPTDATLFTSSTSVGSLAFTVTAPAPTAVTTTTVLAVSPATAVAPGSATLTATVSGAGAEGTVEFWNGTAMAGYNSLGSSKVVAGVASWPMAGLAAGSYSYTAIFTPMDAAAFTSSYSGALAFSVTAATPSDTAITWMSRTHGDVGTWVLLRGTGFGTHGVVRFGTVSAPVAIWTAGTIVVKVPAGLHVGSVRVTVTASGGTASNSVRFRVESRHGHGHGYGFGYGRGHHGHGYDD